MQFSSIYLYQIIKSNATTTTQSKKNKIKFQKILFP